LGGALIAALGLFGIVACERLVDPALPPAAVAFSTPEVYATWWGMTEACSGIHAPLSAVTWYVVPTSSGSVGIDGAIAYWSAASNRIVLAEGHLLDGAIVRHEMLHSLLGVGDHPRAQFLSRCAGIVECNKDCVISAGPLLPDTSGLVVPADSLDLLVAVEPAQPAAHAESGTFRVTIFAHNRLARAVLVDPVAGLPLGSQRWGFGFLLSGTRSSVGNTSALNDESVFRFTSNETKKVVYDFVVDTTLTERSARPDSYTVHGSFGPRVTKDIAFTVIP
jgi:hypothetical protein